MVNYVENGTVIHGVIHEANYMVKSTHKPPPARIRYEQSHPTMSCRLDKDSHALLKQRLEDLGGVSFADFVKDSLGLLQLKMPDKDNQIWYYCAVCQERIDMKPNSGSHKAIIGYMKEHGWAHSSCRGGART